MIKRICYLLLFLLVPNILFADTYIVNNVEPANRDLTGSVNCVRDGLGKPCAVLKISIPVSARFKGDIYGSVNRIGNEYTLHISTLSKNLTIYPDNGNPVEFEFSDFPCYPYEPRNSYRVDIILLNNDKNQENFDSYSFQDLIHLGESGNADACYAVACAYTLGSRNQKVDYAKGLEWMSRAAKLNHVEAQCDVGKYYFNGYGVEKNLEEAYKWFKMAADNNNGNAQYMMALRYCSNINDMTEQDIKDAKYWLNRAISNKYILAYGHLSLISYKENHEEEAFEYAKILALEGNFWGQFILGTYYGIEESANYDLEESVFWLELAAEAGLPDAQVALAKYIESNFGRSDKEKTKESKFWYSKAAENGNQDARVALKRLN